MGVGGKDTRQTSMIHPCPMLDWNTSHRWSTPVVSDLPSVSVTRYASAEKTGSAIAAMGTGSPSEQNTLSPAMRSPTDVQPLVVRIGVEQAMPSECWGKMSSFSLNYTRKWEHGPEDEDVDR